MATKKEVIEQAEELNIRFKQSWNKQKIIDAIASGVKKDDPIWVTCSRSGLVFNSLDFNSERLSVHPTIRRWFDIKDYAVVARIVEKGKEAGWTTLEQFEESLEKAFKEPEYTHPTLTLTDGGGRKCWVAKINGLHETYDFERSFLKEEEIDGRERTFELVEDGIYQSKEYSRKGNEAIRWWLKTSNDLTEIDYHAVCDSIGGDPLKIKQAKAEQKRKEEALIVGSQKGHGEAPYSEGQVFYLKQEDDYFVCVNSKTEWLDREYADDIGLMCDPDPAFYEITYRKATKEETDKFLVEQAEQERRKQERANLRQRYTDLLKACFPEDSEKVEPENADFPEGTKVILRETFYHKDYLVITNDKIWKIIYNGRDGDMWCWNNVGNMYIGSWIERTNQPVEELISVSQQWWNLIEQENI